MPLAAAGVTVFFRLAKENDRNKRSHSSNHTSNCIRDSAGRRSLISDREIVSVDDVPAPEGQNCVALQAVHHWPTEVMARALISAGKLLQ